MTKFIIETDDRQEALKYAKALDFAALLFEMKHNMWREWKSGDKYLTLDTLKDKIQELFESHGINEEDIS